MASRTSSTSSSEGSHHSYFSDSEASSENQDESRVNNLAALTLSKQTLTALDHENRTLRRRSKSFCGEYVEENSEEEIPAGVKVRKHSKTDASKLAEERLGINDSVALRRQEKLMRTLSLGAIESNRLELEEMEKAGSTPRPKKSDKIQRAESSRSTKDIILGGKKVLGFRKSKLNFPYTLSCPSLTKEEWERNVLRKLERFAKGKEMLEPSTLIASFVSTAVNTTTIIRRIDEAQSLVSFPFLEGFRENRNPKSFLKAIRKLHKKERRILIEIIGGETALSLLKLCLDKKVQKAWELHLIRARQINEACRECESRVVFFSPNFDKEHPISAIKFSDVRDSFRSFICADADHHCFQFNGTPIEMPEIEQDSDFKRKVDFMEWLISYLKGVPFMGQLSLREQARLICKGALNAEEKKILIEKLQNFLIENSLSDFKTVLNQLKAHSFSDDFMRWARKNLADILYVEAEQDPETLAKKAIAQFEIDFNLKVLKRDVPCYRLLQSISFSAFSTVPAYLSQTFCPSLFDLASNQPLMKTFPTDNTRYEIKIDSSTGQYEATQVKLYTFYQRGASEADRFILGRVEVLWTVCGNIAGETRTAKLSFRNFQLDDRVDIDFRTQIMKGFGFFH